MSIKTIIETTKTAFVDFKEGFKEGYHNTVTEREEDEDVIIADFKEEKSTVSRVGSTLGIIIGYISKLFSKPLVKTIASVVGITTAILSAILNMVLIGTVINFILVSLPLLVIAVLCMIRMSGGNINTHVLTVEAFSIGMIAMIGVLGVLSNVIMGSWLLALACVVLYAVPFMSYI